METRTHQKKRIITKSPVSREKHHQMKKLLVLAIAFLLINAVKSQDHKLQFEVGPTLGIPIGGMHHESNYGLGIEGIVRYKMSDNINYFGQTGVDFFRGNSVIITHIPVMAGLRFTANRYIAGMGIGYGLYNFGHGYSQSGFAYSPQIGYNFNKIDFLLKYNSTLIAPYHYDFISLSWVYKF